MARIFISHSSANNAEAAVLRDWLAGNGWADLFLDFDADRGIAAGERWEQALSEAANRCEAVIFLVSRHWLASKWCLRELHLALKLNKRLFALLLEPIPKDDLPAELVSRWQLVDLQAGSDHAMYRATLPDGSVAHVTLSQGGLARLRNGLAKAGLDARFFAWPPVSDPDRAPYRGLRSLEGEDAGIFFGREAPTIEVLDRLRGLSELATPKVFTVLGASGAGKSSFLRAGLLPRLIRDDESFRVLPIIRPGRAALSGETGLLRALETGLAQAGVPITRAAVREAIAAGVEKVVPLIAAIAAAGARAGDDIAPPAIVLPIDQGEELFQADGAEEASAFLTLVSDLVRAPGSRLIALVTIRSDSFESLQTASALEAISINAFSLPPMPRGAYQIVIEGPAARLSESTRTLTVEPALTAKLLEDLEAGGSKDALPLLAFTLERLYVEHGGDGDLRRSEYEAIGGVRGAIEAAVESALARADGDRRLPGDRSARLVLLRKALIPWLAGIDPDTGTPRRRVARLGEIPAEARPLIDHLVEARLLISDRDAESGEQTVETAHEALLRQWDLLEGWLEADLAILTTAESLRRAAREWDANGRHADWLIHSAGRLEDAEALQRRPEIAPFVADAAAYVEACHAAELARRRREREEIQARIRRQRRLLVASSVAAVLFAFVALFAVLQFNQSAQNLNFALDATDNLALSIARGLEFDMDVPTREKTFFATSLEESFRQLPAGLRERNDFGRRYADLLISNALMFFNVGRTDLGAVRAAEARTILDRDAGNLPRSMRMRLSLVEALAALDRLDLARATAAIDSGVASAAAPVEGYDAHILGRLHLARLGILATQRRYEDMPAIETEARALVRKALADGPDEGLARGLYMTLFGLTGRLIDVADAEWRDLGPLVAARREELDEARELFDGGRSPLWRYYDAYQLVSASKVSERNGNIAEAIDVASSAIESIEELSIDDPEHVLYRMSLMELLTGRANYAIARQDHQQARVDIAAASALMLDMRARLPQTSELSWQSGSVDYARGRLATSMNDNPAAAKAYESVVARSDVWMEHFVDPGRLRDMSTRGHEAALRAYGQNGDLEKAREHGNKALALLDLFEQANGPRLHALTQRSFVLQSLMQLQPRAEDPAVWDRYHAEYMTIVDRIVDMLPGNHSWHASKAYAIGLRAAQFAIAGQHEAAIADYLAALRSERESHQLGAPMRTVSTNTFYYTREAVESQTEIGDWNGMLDVLAGLDIIAPTEDMNRRELGEFLVWSRALTEVVQVAVSKAESSSSPQASALGTALSARQHMDRLVQNRIATINRTDPGRALLDPRSLDLGTVQTDTSGGILQTAARFGFNARPSIRGDWRSLFGDEFAVARSNFAATPLHAPNADRIERIRALNLPFYRDGTLYEAEYADDRGGTPLAAIMVVGGKIYVLNGTSPPIHQANADNGLLLDTMERARAYLVFFCAFITGTGNAFFIVENADDIHWRPDASGAVKAQVGRALRPMVLWPDPEQAGKWHATITVQYGDANADAVFHALMSIDSKGIVQMANDMPVATDLPIAQPLYGAGVRMPRVVQAVDLEELGAPLVTNEPAALERIAGTVSDPELAGLLRSEAAAIRSAAASTPTPPA